ncbi:hypothetical protein FEM48_Zijuj11G0136000 [Ziziphus jujuba var. spinosa]|uniref:DUF4220 domain-containing protein n=1 Tax=Ziziphus jujuba var. spinosa TaxID=714518 RepID=A0A978UJ86_ZIZJJ|nr:hypothetical protein FEM48_Zijuj11G0136000 [Ziziphus jujuba var. spinosa]
MELSIILNKLNKLWDTWDIPTCILLSLFLQVFLVLFASFRQHSKNSFLLFLIWSAYLSADWIAAFTVGLITKVLTDPSHPHANEGLYAFWASFLLLHLGGPDTITSFALEDNEFWLRHLFGLILQVVGAAYCIFLTLPNNNLLLPTILVFVVGSVKYAERTMALYLASLDHFEDTVLGLEDPNAKPERDGTEFDFNLPSESSNHIELLMVSYSLFKSFEGIIFGYRPSFKLVESSKKLFGQIKNPNVGFKLMEYELSFMYEVFHTKAAAVRSRIGVIFRLISFCFILGAFILFHFVVVKDYHDEFVDFEMSLTYALLIGATALDTISAVKLILFFDWILVSSNGLIKRWRKFVPEYVLKRRRWCESVFQYNMIDHCLGERWLWKYNLPDYVRVMVDKIKIMLFSSSTDNIGDLKRFIFENGEKLKKPTYKAVESPDDWMGFAELHDELRYTEQVLQLHLVTEVCYHQTQTESSKYTEEGERSRRICKVISDYMFYLLIMKPEILGPSSMGIDWKKIFQKTFEEARAYLKKHQISDRIEACKELIHYNVKEGDVSENVLSKACLSAQKLKLEKHWKSLSYEWLQGLCFGALRNRQVLHAEQAGKGGELLTFIWFLLHHLGGSLNINIYNPAAL